MAVRVGGQPKTNVSPVEVKGDDQKAWAAVQALITNLNNRIIVLEGQTKQNASR